MNEIELQEAILFVLRVLLFVCAMGVGVVMAKR